MQHNSNKLLNRYVQPKILSCGTRLFNGQCDKQFYTVAVPAYCGVPRALVKEFSSPYRTVRVVRAGSLNAILQMVEKE